MARVANDLPADETIAEIVTGDGDGRRTYRCLIYGAVATSLAAVLIVSFKPLLFPPGLAERAAKLITLPPQAKVSAVTEGREDRDGTIVFSLPEPKGPGSRLTEIWTLNGNPAPPPPPAPSRVKIAGAYVSVPAPPVMYAGMPTVSKHRLSISMPYGPGEGVVTNLSFDPVRKVYRYERKTNREDPTLAP